MNNMNSYEQPIKELLIGIVNPLLEEAVKKYFEDPDSNANKMLQDLKSSAHSGYMTRREAAEYLSVCKTTIDNLSNKGQLKKYYSKNGGFVRFKKEDLDNYIMGKKIS